MQSMQPRPPHTTPPRSEPASRLPVLWLRLQLIIAVLLVIVAGCLAVLELHSSSAPQAPLPEFTGPSVSFVPT